MKKIVFALLAVALLCYCSTISYAQKDKNKVSMYSTSSNEALSFFTDGLKYYDQWDNIKAREYLLKAIKQDPSFAIAYIHLATLSTTPQEAVSYLDKAKEHISGANEWEKLLYDYTETYLTDNKDSRLEIAKKMASSFPSSARACYYLGMAYGDRADFANSRKCYQKAVTLEPEWPTGYLALANSFIFTDPKDFKKAEETAKKLSMIAPSNRSYILLGDTYRAQNDLRKAEETFSKAIAEDPQAPDGYYRRGTVLTLLGRYDEARKLYEKAGALDVVPTWARLCISYTYLYQNEASKALMSIDNDLQTITPTLDATQRNQFQLGLLMSAAMIAWHIQDVAKLQEIANALQPLTQDNAVRLGTEEAKLRHKARVFFWASAIDLINNNIDGAKQNAEQYKITVEPIKDPQQLTGYYLLLGRAAMIQHDYKTAVNYLEKTSKLDIYHQYWMAKAYEANGQKDKAFAIYKYLVNFNFDDVSYALIRNEIKKKMR